MKRIDFVALVTLALGSACWMPGALAVEAVHGSVSDVNKLIVTMDSSGVVQNKKVVPAVANHSDEPPLMNGEPEHVRITFGKDKVSDYTDYTQRQLLVYPVARYATLFKGKEKAAFDKVVPELKAILTTKSDHIAKSIPMLPAAESYEVFHNQVKYLNFKSGSGIAYLTAYAQDEAPLKNGDFFYTFQGLTGDGKYYVSFFCPVTVKQAPEKMSSKKGAAYLGKLPRTAFEPSLDAIDNALRSISISMAGNGAK